MCINNWLTIVWGNFSVKKDFKMSPNDRGGAQLGRIFNKKAKKNLFYILSF